MGDETREMPLFPLGTVLFPGMLLPLHIFEQRYRIMINECVEQGTPFGVLLIEQGHEVGEPAKPYTIGTTARITHVQPFDDGRMNIQTVGHQRFRVVKFIKDKPYLAARVTDYPIATQPTEDTQLLTDSFSPALKQYLDLLIQATETDIKLEQLPDDGMALALFAAITMPLPMKDKQKILEQESIDAMLRMERSLIKREMMLLQHMLRQGGGGDDSVSFSAN
jgi:Lon protease-like protein